MAKRYPDVDPAFDRLKQEMAKLEGMKQECLADLKATGGKADEQAKRAREVMADLQPIVQKWADAGMPKSDKAGSDAGVLYVEAAQQLRDALAGNARAGQVLESKHAEPLLGA